MITILVVEDDKNTRTLTEAKLRKYYNIVSAENGEEALDAIYNQKIDFIVSDIMMPVMDGYELLENLKKENISIPILFLTAKSEFEDKKKSYEKGIDDFITKPINYDELILKIDAILRRCNISNDRELKIGKIILNTDNYTVKNENDVIEFTNIASFLSLLLIMYVSNGNVMSWSVIRTSLGIVFPMAVLLGIIGTILSKHLYNQTVDLANALERAANGDFHAKLDNRHAGTMAKAYENFNKLEEQLKKTSKMQDDFVNSYSHEFKTPITSIKGFAEMLLEEDLSEEEKKKYLQIILQESERLTHLANTSILYTKLNSKEIVEDKEEYYLDEQIRQCAIIMQPDLKDKNIDLECNLQQIKYYSNYNMMQEVWINLISNGIKYTNKGGKITISLDENDNNIIAIVQDNGVGMSKEQIEHIFEKYYQVDKSKHSMGLGIGLSIVYRVMELVNGKIEVESELGKGSKFIITLKKYKE